MIVAPPMLISAFKGALSGIEHASVATACAYSRAPACNGQDPQISLTRP